MSLPSNPTIEQEPKKTSAPTVEPLDVEADREAILGLWRRNLPEGTDERYDWLYRSGRARSWIARDVNHEAIGAVGLMGREMSLFGETVHAGQPVDLNVDRRHRIGGLAMRLQRAVTDEVAEGRLGLIYGLPNPQSEPVLRRAGYEVIAQIQRWARPLRTHEYLEDWLPKGTLGKVAGMAAGRPASLGLDTALWLRSPESRYRRRRDYRVEITDCFDSRFDELWRAASERFGIIGARTAEYLDWRFRQAPECVYRAICLSDRSDRLLAYLVYTCQEGVAYVADFLHVEERYANAIMAEFVNLMRMQRAKAIVMIFTGGKSVVGRLNRFGFQRRPSPWRILLHTDAIRLDVPRYKLTDVGNWFLTRADIDTEF